MRAAEASREATLTNVSVPFESARFVGDNGFVE
jgi:hypothetical protein